MFKIGVLLAVSLFYFNSCAGKDESEAGSKSNTIDIVKVGSIQLQDSIDQAENIMEGLHVVDELGIAYGIDYRKRLPYKLSLLTGDFQHLSSPGSGPKELRSPSQLSMKDSSEFYVYDTSLDIVAHFVNDELVEKTEGFLKHNVWLRNTKGYYWKGHIITSIKEPDKVNAYDFKNAKPLAFLNLADSTLMNYGEFSPTVDELDPNYKYPMITFHHNSKAVFYVFKTDFTVMKYDIQRDTTFAVGHYKPQQMRERTVPVDPDNSDVRRMARIYGLDLSKVVEVDTIDQKLIVVWQNATKESYDQRGYTTKHNKYFGVLYDLPDMANPREFSLPGKFLGAWENRLLVQENDDPLEFLIGFYEFLE